jgi:hypothetical protein
LGQDHCQLQTNRLDTVRRFWTKTGLSVNPTRLALVGPGAELANRFPIPWHRTGAGTAVPAGSASSGGGNPDWLAAGSVLPRARRQGLSAASETTPSALWASLDNAWQEAFRQAWDAFRTGNIAVGACATTADGKIVHAARNRVADDRGPAGEVFGSSLAHAEVNVLARIALHQPRVLVLTTTLEP